MERLQDQHLIACTERETSTIEEYNLGVDRFYSIVDRIRDEIGEETEMPDVAYTVDGKIRRVIKLSAKGYTQDTLPEELKSQVLLEQVDNATAVLSKALEYAYKGAGRS